MDSIFNRLKRCRAILGLNQSEMAKVLGMSQRDISELEAGKKKFIPTDYIQFLNNQNFSIDWIFNGGPDWLIKRPYQWIYSKDENEELSNVGVREGEYYKIDLTDKSNGISKDEFIKLMELSKQLEKMKPILDKIKHKKSKF